MLWSVSAGSMLIAPLAEVAPRGRWRTAGRPPVAPLPTAVISVDRVRSIWS
ncbi:hypothetical protein ACWENQ_44310 [Nonomuraea sp. NPDC004354]